MKDILEEVSNLGNRKIGFAMFGCPHFSLAEAQYIAGKIEGKAKAQAIISQDNMCFWGVAYRAFYAD